jgi:HEAT repeat protein
MKILGCSVLGFAFWVTAALAQPPELPSQFANCQTLQACMRALDGVAPSRQSGAGSPSLDRQFAERLETFGEPAKHELLKRAAGQDKGWRELAGWLLMYWRSFDDHDVPDLIAALHADPGGGAARPLGAIGTPEAINALVEDVRVHGAENQSGFALSQLGDRAFPYLMPFLSDDRQWREAATILRDMKSKAVDGLDAWLTIALDARKSERERVGALRGIGILGTSVKEVGPRIRPLLSTNDGDEPIPETTRNVLVAMGDETMISKTVGGCEPSNDPFGGSFDSTICLERAAAYGGAALPFANLILTTFTYSRTGPDRANGASFLGYVGYGAAKERLHELLTDTDWRVVYAAARSLRWLGATEAIPELANVAKTHWLPDVRNEAAKSIAAIQASTGAQSRPVAGEGTLGFPPWVPLEVGPAPDTAQCQSGRWTWNDREFRAPTSVSMAVSIGAANILPAGVLKGRDRGEWGGEVIWDSPSAKPMVVAEGNVEGMQPDRDGAIAVMATTIYERGYAIEMNRDSSGAWRVEEIARFPSAAFGLSSIDRDHYVAWSGNRAIIFTPHGVEAVATCMSGG